MRRDDWRVAHNRAVAQYLLSNLTKTDEFRRNLLAIELHFERDAETRGCNYDKTRLACSDGNVG